MESTPHPTTCSTCGQELRCRRCGAPAAPSPVTLNGTSYPICCDCSDGINDMAALYMGLTVLPVPDNLGGLG